jgi:predicted nucleic acid-binding protein
VIVVDSSVWISYFRAEDRPSVRLLRSLRNPADILVGDLVLLEILQGARDERHAESIERDMREFNTVAMLGPEMASKAAANYRRLRERGMTVRKTVDTLIATFCIENSHQLLHQDRDFSHFEKHLGLRVL